MREGVLWQQSEMGKSFVRPRHGLFGASEQVGAVEGFHGAGIGNRLESGT
jgi:hypothetical protein